MVSSIKIILLVEDDPNDVILIRRALKSVNAQAHLFDVGDGEKAIKYLVGEDEFADRTKYLFPDIVLLDLKLPRKSGLEVIEWVRAQEEIKSLPIVMLTSSKQAADIYKAYDLGANSYLVKPVAYENLVSMMDSFKNYWLKINVWPPKMN
jgi:DNA-binding response OmpR family regulator